jgi:hypothetical protein
MLHAHVKYITNEQIQKWNLDEEWYSDMKNDFLTIYSRTSYSDTAISEMEQNFLSSQKEDIQVSWNLKQSHQKRMQPRARILPPRPFKESVPVTGFNEFNMQTPPPVNQNRREAFLKIINNK